MKKALCLLISSLVLLTSSITSFASSTSIPSQIDKTNKVEHKLDKLEIQKRFNPLRNNSLDTKALMNTADYNDKNVQIISVTYVDEFGNIKKEYKGGEALNHLQIEYARDLKRLQYDSIEEMEKSFNPTSAKATDTFEGRVIKYYVEDSAKNTTIRKPSLDFTQGNFGNLFFNAGMAFSRPVYSIIYAAISEFLVPPQTNVTYKAGDVTQREIYTFFNSETQLRSTTIPNSKWFPVLNSQRREVDLTSSYYVVDNKYGDITTFQTRFGLVEENLDIRYTRSESDNVREAKSVWNKYPYVYTYSWNPNHNSEAMTLNYSRTPRTTVD